MIPIVDHFAFRVADLEASIQFYGDIIGLELLSKTVDEVHHEAFAFFKLDGGNLELLQLLDESNNPIPYQKPPINQPYCPHLAIKADDLGQLVIDLQNKNVSIVKGPMEIPAVVKWFYVADPDHNIIEYVQWINQSEV